MEKQRLFRLYAARRQRKTKRFQKVSYYSCIQLVGYEIHIGTILQIFLALQKL